MQPDFFAVRKDKRNSNKNNRKSKSDKEGNWITDTIVLLSKGDITKKDDILWGVTLEEVNPFVKYQQREVLFRDAILSYLGVKSQDEVVDEYCIACRQAGLDKDCASCDRDIKVAEEKKRDRIGG